MARRKTGNAPPALDPELIRDRLRPPLGVVLGSPREVAELVARLPTVEVVCYQMDLYQAERLREELDQRGAQAQVVTTADLWDLPADFQTLLYPVPPRGERDLKIDMVEQAFHVLRPRGVLIVWSPGETDQLFPPLLKKVFGRVHAPQLGLQAIFWCQRDGNRPRRRHEVTFQVRLGPDQSLRFLSRPGVFAYGRFDEGARALIEVMHIDPGDRVLDIGCGCGTNGIIAGLRSGPTGSTVFVDSNRRALALTEHNARSNGLTLFEVIASSSVEGVQPGSIDVALANPPYYAQVSIAQLFLERARILLRPGGRLYLVTKQPDQVGPRIAEAFGQTEVVLQRGYAVLCATAPSEPVASGTRSTEETS
jgi:16S rRNA (guanine1207-N2)-methyltransferase